MKLKIGDKVYLQKYEVAHLMHSLNSFPGSVLDEVFSDGEETGLLRTALWPRYSVMVS